MWTISYGCRLFCSILNWFDSILISGKFVGLTRQRRTHKDSEPLYYMNTSGKEFVLPNRNRVLPPIHHLGKEVDNELYEQPRKWEVSTTYLPTDDDVVLPQLENNDIPVEPVAQSITRNATPDAPPVYITKQEEEPLGHEEQPYTDENSVFKATGNQKETADEVKDDKRVRIEKTIDMLPAATVVEELAGGEPTEKNDEEQ